MSFTLGTIISHTTEALGNNMSLTSSQVSFWANRALEQIWWLQSHAERETLATSSTTSGENRINLPTDFAEMISLSDTSSNPPDLLRQIQPEDVDSGATDYTRPRYYVLWDDHLELYPTPDSAYSLSMRYLTDFTELSASTASMSVATRWGLAWQYKTNSMVATQIQDFALAQLYDDLYKEQLLTVPNDFALRQRPRYGAAISLLTQGRGRRHLDFDYAD